MNITKHLSIVGVVGFILIGCASKPESLTTNYVSPYQYKNYDCEQIGQETTRVSRRVNELYYSLDKKASNDQMQMASAFLVWPMLFTLEGGDGPEAQEYSRLKGEYNALQEIATTKKCNLALPAPTGPITPLVQTQKEQETKPAEAVTSKN